MIEDISRRFNECRVRKPAKVVSFTSDQIAEDIRQFEAKGGKITRLKIGETKAVMENGGSVFAHKNAQQRNWQLRQAERKAKQKR